MTARRAFSLDTLVAQVDAIAPHRGKDSDGWLGDAAHQARTSDHNPNAAGVVCAQDLTHDPPGGFDSYAFAEVLRQRQDDRVKYVISKRRICYGPRSPSHGGNPSSLWKWNVYSGPSPHTDHVHISVGDPRFYDKTEPWDLTGFSAQPAPPPVAVHPTLQVGSTGEDVKWLQQKLMVDGIYGSLTEQAVMNFQAANGLAVDGIVGPLTWAALKPPDLPPPQPDAVWNTGIIATVFGGVRSAYDNALLNDTDLYTSLPWRFSHLQPLDFRAGSKVVPNVPIRDVGPWLTDDDYWSAHARPLAETCYLTRKPLPRGPNKGKVPNGAGIDLSPALARALAIAGKGKVDWKFSAG